MIQLHNIHKSFGTLEVLKGIDLTINQGEVVSIVGPSGAGKTTLLQILGTLDRPDSGQVLFDGIDISLYKEKQLAAFRNRHIGFVFQFHQLLPEFTAVENVMMPALIGGANMSDARQRAMEMLNYLHLTDRASHKPSELSGGEKQRVAVARALVNRPKVILADEPCGNLDSKMGAEIMEILSELNKKDGRTVVMVTHNEEQARQTDRIIRFFDGRQVM